MQNRISSLLVLAAFAPFAASFAQTSESDPVTAALEVGRSVLDAERQTVIAEALPLTREEGEQFWPVYREYHRKPTRSWAAGWSWSAASLTVTKM